jgi:LTXXQ motif family protein
MLKQLLKLLLAVLVVTIAATSAADARRRGHHGFFAREEFTRQDFTRQDSARPEDGEERGRRSEAQERFVQEQERRAQERLAQQQQMQWQRGGAASFGAIVDEIARGCRAQAAELKAWPFERIAETVKADAAQRHALDALREAAVAAADKLAGECPAPALPVAGLARGLERGTTGRGGAESTDSTQSLAALRLDAAETAIEAVTAALAAVEPALRDLYAALDDEQKARLVRGLGNEAAERTPDRRRPRAAAEGGGVPWSGICERLTPALRDWPRRGIEQAIRLSDAQKVVLYELYAAALKAADTLGGACPADTALTPLRRMELVRARLAAVRGATSAIRPALMRFHDALDGAQQQRFAQMN